VTAGGSPTLERWLRRPEGTVTELVEALVGEPLDAEARRHVMIEAELPNPLAVGAGHPLLARAVRLTGRVSRRPYVYAETMLVVSRISSRFLERLASTADPIGRILRAEGTPVTRTPLAGQEASPPAFGARQPPAPGDVLLNRQYRVDMGGVPVMVITEWFLTPLQQFLPASGAPGA